MNDVNTERLIVRVVNGIGDRFRRIAERRRKRMKRWARKLRPVVRTIARHERPFRSNRRRCVTDEYAEANI